MMQIDSINLYNESITMGNVIDSKSQKVNFEEIMDNEVKKNASIEELVKNIESNHNAKITISSDFFSANSIKGLNNVIVRQSIQFFGGTGSKSFFQNTG